MKSTPDSISEALEKLEAAGKGKSAEVRSFLDNELSQIKNKLKDLEPLMNDVKDKAEIEITKRKNEVESKVKENPWLALGAVGLVAFVVGWLIGGKRRD